MIWIFLFILQITGFSLSEAEQVYKQNNHQNLDIFASIFKGIISSTRDVFDQLADKFVIPGINTKLDDNVKLDSDFEDILDNILIERSPGTEGNLFVQQYLISQMRNLGWSIEEDKFRAATPEGTKPFNNIIATHNPKACKRLVLACHYDSLFKSDFVGATDSAVSCSIMVHLANQLTQRLNKNQFSNISLEYIFLDGEESFRVWSETDSLYGSRHLAELWSKTGLSDLEQDKCTIKTRLDRIQTFILLDLLGSSNPKIYSHFRTTANLYDRISRAEQKLNDLGQMYGTTKYFVDLQAEGVIFDDHIPFLRRGVQILHIIPTPFPRVWHKITDHKENLDFAVVNNLIRILREFLAEYFAV